MKSIRQIPPDIYAEGYAEKSKKTENSKTTFPKEICETMAYRQTVFQGKDDQTVPKMTDEKCRKHFWTLYWALEKITGEAFQKADTSTIESRIEVQSTKSFKITTDYEIYKLIKKKQYMLISLQWREIGSLLAPVPQIPSSFNHPCEGLN